MGKKDKGGEMEVVVYCASSAEIHPLYFDAASRLGVLLAENEIVCVNGAGCQGLMGALNDAVLSNGGHVKGIIPRFMVDAGWGHRRLTETIITETMHERKNAMASTADGVIALPGGIGTLEELAEIITWKQLGLFRKPIVILNINHYYDLLISFLEQMIDQNFMKEDYRSLWRVASTPEEAVELLKVIPEWSSADTKYD